jgi:hypothetical protein
VSQNFRYCQNVYKVMDEEAHDHIPEDDSSKSMRVWEGFFTKLITDRLSLSVPYYSTIRTNLMRMGCIRQLRRGGGSAPSQWELLRPPTEELWFNSPSRRSYQTSKTEANSEQLNDINRRVKILEENFDVMARAFVDQGGRIPLDEPKPSKHFEVIEE